MSPRSPLSLRSLVVAALVLGSLALVPVDARASSIGVVFDGPASTTGQHFGLSADRKSVV